MVIYFYGCYSNIHKSTMAKYVMKDLADKADISDIVLLIPLQL